MSHPLLPATGTQNAITKKKKKKSPSVIIIYSFWGPTIQQNQEFQKRKFKKHQLVSLSTVGIFHNGNDSTEGQHLVRRKHWSFRTKISHCL